MDLDEWEVIPSTTPKPLPLFLGPDLFVETDYFRCPATPPPPPATLPHHQHQHQQQDHQPKEEEKEDEKEEYEDEEPKYEEPSSEDDEPTPVEFKDIPISTEFINNDTSPALAPATAQVSAIPPPFNWLEPDPVVFDRGTDRYDVMARKKELVADGKDCAGFNLWSLVNGIGAICSFGVATAATLCVFAIGAASASDSGRLRPGPNIQFQIYSHDKRIKEVVQRATGLNHAVSAARGIGAIPRAQITFGGHYEGL